MKFYSVKEAKAKNLVPVYEWLPNTKEEKEFLRKASAQLMLNPGRTYMFVIHKNKKEITMFANSVVSSVSVANNTRKSRANPNKSISGKYKNIRHLAECLFSLNEDLSYQKFALFLKSEFPNANAIKLFYAYKALLVKKRQFVYIPLPKWCC